MTDQLPSRLFVRGYLVSGLITVLVGGGLVLTGHTDPAFGVAAGAAVALLMIHGTVMLGTALVDQSRDEAKKQRRFRRVLAFQVGKYAVAIGALYLLVTRTEISPLGIVVGYGIPLVVLVVGCWAPSTRPTPGE